MRWGDMPRSIRQGVIAIEDENFYKHKGVDFNAIVRAGVRNVEEGKTVEGGSTVTQQLVRALYIKDPERNFTRKIREAKLASELEDRHSKTWILREYLNSVPFGTVGGRTAIGVQAAAQTFFSKDAKDLTLAESALLAGLPQAPSQYNPFRNPSAAVARRANVLKAMAKNGYITRAQAERANDSKLGIKRGTRYTDRREPYFFDYVQEKLIEDYGVGVYRRGGLKVHTTIDPKLQKAGRAAINGQLGLPDDPSSAIVSIDPKTGYIRAMASSGTYKDRSFNLAAQGHRQPGSAFKTMVLTAAIRQGYNPNSTTYTSKKLDLNVPGYGPWKVSTYSNTYGGRMNLVKATTTSDNTVYAQLIIDVGPEEVKKTAKLLGIKTKLDGFLAEGLGGLRLGVTPLEMANAYATLASGGIRSEPTAIKRVEFPGGKKDVLSKPKRKRVISDGVAYEVTRILEQNVQSGTGTKARINCPAAGKTGTTDSFNDAWFAGYTTGLSTAVWVGYPNALREMRSVHGIEVAGGTFPTQIWGAFMGTATSGTPCSSFPQPTTPASFGRSGSSGSALNSGSSSSSSGSTGAPGPQGGYSPQLYESAPQQSPQQVAPPAIQETPSDGGGGGGNNGGGGFQR
ncbi:MAG: transglycosylase domain-containing protein [Thermoleophilaceae bacterium]|nr:transglycosylase domain-containing protein [Thermoleophilaceae bacterium]